MALAALTAVAWSLTGGMPAAVARYPRAVLVSLAALAALLVVGALRRAPSSDPGVSWPGRAAMVRAAALAAVIVAYAIAFDVLGHLAATALSVPAMMRLAGERRWPWLVAVPLIGAAGLQVVFGGLLGVPLPRGRLMP